MKFPIVSFAIILTLSLDALNAVYAGSATWNLNPNSGDWNTAENWTPNTVPNGPADVATFGTSTVTDLSVSEAMTEVAAIVFNPGASSFNITSDPKSNKTTSTLTISGAGIVNNSGVTQNLAAVTEIGKFGLIYFVNGASAGDGTTVTASGAITEGLYAGASIYFLDTSTCGTANIIIGGAQGKGFRRDRV